MGDHVMQVGRPDPAREALERNIGKIGEVKGWGHKRVTVVFEDDGFVRRVDRRYLLVVKQLNGQWVDNWDEPRLKPDRRIIWTPHAQSGRAGWVGGHHFFTISHRLYSTDPAWLMTSKLPGDNREWKGDDRDRLETAAEKALEAWVNQLGAVFQRPELRADRLRDGNAFEAVVKASEYHVRFYYDWTKQECGCDGEGVARTLNEAAALAMQDAQKREDTPGRGQAAASTHQTSDDQERGLTRAPSRETLP